MLLDVIENHELGEFLEEMTANRSRFPVNKYETLKQNDQKTWYFDDEVFMAMVDMQVRWYSTYSDHEYQVDLRKRLVAAQSEEVILASIAGELDFLQRCVVEIVGTRSARWEFLSDYLGLDLPRSFVAYRGTKDPDVAITIVNAWESGMETFKVPHVGLSSWSFLEGDSNSGARHHLKGGQPGSLLVAEVSLEETFLDVFVDDAYFAHHGLREAEIIVGNGSPDMEISAMSNRCRILVNRQEYGPETAMEAREALKKLDY